MPTRHVELVPSPPQAPGGDFLHLALTGGHLTFWDGTRPPDGTTLFRVPRRHLALTTADLDRLTGTSLRGGLADLVAGCLTVLAAETGRPGSPVAGRLARSAADLLAILALDLAGPDEPGGALLPRIRAFIEDHLTDPALGPESIARAHHISVRYLHKLFQSDGTTVGRWIRRRRLDSCRHELASRTVTVAAVAHRWGFTSPSHFSRTFRDAYGMSPREWRVRAR
ncbi:helix-turn-helix domain-containing protein [Streptomyces roseirectus]|uniref:Helix-turn-helix domain-containing protein n=1 Tax=Streptomyces roseirectus TaxID=2768066 RepID=A0A7H0IRM4_9ACTN|nr:helix-turn-helix domain-containing protein [Streptomyces roseirectus]QNP75440.1 helix-turn-helix domain-containing protein [Streptomyces roseirectus]